MGMHDLVALRVSPLSMPAFFVSPELTEDDPMDSEVSSESDIYSLGIMLWYLFLGHCSRPSLSGGIRDPLRYQDLHPLTSVTDFFYRVKHGHLRPEVEMWLEMGALHEKAANLMTSCWSSNPHDRPFCGAMKIDCETLKNEFDIASSSS